MRSITVLAFLVVLPGIVLAHASEQGFVLLLPTDIYITAGAASVALTVLLLALLPDWVAERLFRPLRTVPVRKLPLRHLASCLSAVFLGFLIWRGLTGPHDPLANPLPLFIWTVWWIALVALQGLLGNHWRWTNPWTGPAALLGRLAETRAPLRYPRVLGYGPGIASFLGFACFLLADLAPADPTRLAGFVGFYWLFTLAGLSLFGPTWMVRAEGITIVMRVYSRMALIGRRNGRLAFGLPGWQVLTRPTPRLGLALLVVILLATGSFDGLNETFWWLGLLGINPLEFPGRSAVVSQNLTGLFVANITLITAFTTCLWLGERIAGTHRPLSHAFCLFAPSILPIALGYHIAHYLPGAMVDGQYVLKFLTDPLASGADLLGLGQFYVTTGFFNTPGTAKLIWLTQAGAVVAGHVIAILLAHALALRGAISTRRALLGQAPLAAFMVAYTFFGLWLLASPRGL